MWNKQILFLTLGISILSISSIFAQNSRFGQIRGIVTDETIGEALIGVNVGLQGTSIGSATNIDGEYRITRIPAGTYILMATSLGYANFQVELEVVGGETIDLDIVLRQETVQGEEVIVSAQAQGQREAINQQIQSDNIVNVVSETKIQELPDFNAASALSRLPGVSTTQSSGEDNKVVIRGLAPKYNAIQVEGIQLASTGSSSIGLSSNPGVGSGFVSNDRSVDLTSVSPYMIRMIEVYKSLTPDMNANSIGGTVNMELREAPSGLAWDAMWQQGYTAKSNTLGNYRAVASVSNRFLDDNLGIYALINAESYDRDADNLNAGYALAAGDAEVDPLTGYVPVEVTSVNFNRHIETRNRLGANLIMDYKIPNGSLKFVNMFSTSQRDYTDHNQSINYNDGRMNWRLSKGENEITQRVHSLKLDYDLSWLEIDLSASYTGARNTLDDSPVITFNQTQAVDISERENIIPEDLVSRQANFRGIDDVILRSGNLFSNFYEEDRYSYKADFKIPFNLSTKVTGFFKFGGQIVNQRTSTDQETPYLGFDGNANSADPGANIANNLAATIRDEFGLIPNDQGVITAATLTSGNEDLFDPFLSNRFGEVYFVSNPGVLIDILNFVIGNPDFDASNEEVSSGSQGGWYDGPYQQLANDYEYREDYLATYAMTKIDIGKLMVIGGARYEEVNSDYFAYNARDQRNAQNQIMFDTTSTASNSFLLPMMQAKFSPFEWMDIRYAYTQTLARPDYQQLSPKFTITQGNPGTIYTGNPDLDPAKSFNHDVSVSFYANKLGLLSIGAFQKTVENFVYTAAYRADLAEEVGLDQLSNYQIVCNQYQRDRLGDRFPSILSCQDGAFLVSPTGPAATIVRPVNNPNDGLVRGLEFDFQHNFWYMPKPFVNMVFGANYARIFSEIETPYYDVITVINTDGPRPRPEPALFDSSYVARLAGQPNHVLNTYLGYDNKGFSARISVLYTSNVFNGSGGVFRENDSFNRDYLRLDFSARQRLPWFDGGAELFLNIQNLNDTNTESSQRSIRGFTSIQNYGLTGNIGVRVRY